MREQIIEKLKEIANMDAKEQRAYDTCITHAFIRAVSAS